MLTVAVAVNLAGGYALSQAPAVREALAVDQRSLTWDVPVPTPTPTAVAPTGTQQVGTPARDLLASLAQVPAGELLGPQFTSAQVAPSTGWTTAPCLSAADPVATLTLTAAAAGTGGVTVQLAAVATGTGTATVDTWRAQLSACGRTAAPVRASRAAAPAGAPSALTATMSPATAPGGGPAPTLAQVAWSRGDVVTVLTFATPEGTAPSGHALDVLRQTAAALDAATTARLAPVCADLAPTVADAGRNPTLDTFTGYTVTRTLTVPAAPPVPAPSAPPTPAPSPLPVPAKVAMPSLAPVLAPTEELWSDKDRDGDLDTLAPVTTAPRGPAPTLVDPAAFTLAPTAADPGPAPQRPKADVSTVEYAVRVPDPDGPGCGWAFTGADGPDDDPTALAELEKAAYEGAVQQAAAARTDAWVKDAAWAVAWRTWAAKDAAYDPVRDYLKAQADATAAYTAALATYQDSVVAYELAAQTPPRGTDQQDEDPPPGPTRPTPTPSPAPTPSPSPTTPPKGAGQ